MLYEAAYPRVLGYALRRTLAPEEAADVVSETFLTAWRRFDDMPPGDEALLWLYGVAQRALANQRRGAQRRGALSGRLAAELGAVVPAWQDPLPSDLAPFATAWHRLRSQDRELLGLMVWEGLSNEQLARVFGCSRALVKLRLHRARRRFARELAEAGIDLGSRTAAQTGHSSGSTASAQPSRHAPSETRREQRMAAHVELKPCAAAGHVVSRRASVRPGTEES